MHGALLEALIAAAAAAKAELASVALPAAREGHPQQAGSPALASSLLLLTTMLLKAAGLSLKRSAAIGSRLPLVAAAAPPGGDGAAAADVPATAASLQQFVAAAAAAVDAGKQQVAATAGQLALAGADEAVSSLAVAQAAYAAFKSLRQALAVEALTAATSLRLQEGKPAEGGVAPAAAADAAAAADSGAADGSKKKDKKKAKGPQGMLLGQGTALLRVYVENAAATAGSSSSSGEDGVESCMAALSLASADVATELQRGLAAVNAALDPQGHALAQHLAALRAVIEANQVGNSGALSGWGHHAAVTAWGCFCIHIMHTACILCPRWLFSHGGRPLPLGGCNPAPEQPAIYH